MKPQKFRSFIYNITSTPAMSQNKIQTHPIYRIASIPADGIGPEVIEAGVTVLKKFASSLNNFDIDFETFDWSSDYYKNHGRYLPEDALVTLKTFDAILFGAVGAPGKYNSSSSRNVDREGRPLLT
jgi:isocitrate/isopropylmalate dehydrogenase